MMGIGISVATERRVEEQYLSTSTLSLRLHGERSSQSKGLVRFNVSTLVIVFWFESEEATCSQLRNGLRTIQSSNSN